MLKFVEEFVKATNGKFPELKYNSAIYYKDVNELCVRFIISAFKLKDFDDKKKQEVQSVLDGLFNGVKVSVQYIKTYADAGVVSNKILEYLNKNYQLIFRRVKDDTMKVTVDEQISVKFFFDAATIKMLESGNFCDDLEDLLERSFSEPSKVSLVETEIKDEDFSMPDTAVKRTDSLRLVNVRPLSKLYARGKIESISQLPNYIVDVKGEGDGIILCGRVSNVAKLTYNNKKYDPNDKKSGPEKKPLVRFSLNDTTGSIDSVIFPSVEESKPLEALKDGDEVICLGRVTTSQHTGGLSYMLNAIFRCEIDFSSIHTVIQKPAPSEYRTIFPEKYTGMSELRAFVDDDEKKLEKFFKGKTVVVFDLETTSKFAASTEIIEIGAIKLVDGVENETFTALVKPSEPIPRDATEINHITNEMVKDAPSIDRVLPDFFKFTEGAILAGHNIENFDFPIIKRVGNSLGYYFDNELIDTLVLARRYMSGRSNFRLESIAKDMKFRHTEAHRALSDVEANVDLLRELVRLKP